MDLQLLPQRLDNKREDICSLASHDIKTGKILFYGSSFFTVWGYDRAAEQMERASGGKLEVINHGFGGATVDELLYFYPRLVKPYSPKMMVFRTGYNEMSQGQTPENAVFLLERLLLWAKQDNPGIRLVVLKIFDTRHATDEFFEKIKAYNALLEERLSGWENVTVADITPFFYEKASDIGTRQNFRDVFVEDGLHLKGEAYPEMAEYMSALLLKELEM